MVSPTDFIHLPCTPDLTEGGISYALRSLPYAFESPDAPFYDRLQRVVADVAVELAFRRYLADHQIPFHVIRAIPLADRDRYDVSLGGHRCELKSYFIRKADQYALIHSRPEVLLNAPALVLSDLHVAEGHSLKDLYLFAFLFGRITGNGMQKKGEARDKEPAYPIHVLPKHWRSPRVWTPVDTLVLKSEENEGITLEINGKNATGEFITQTAELKARLRTAMETPLYSVSSIHIRKIPAARLAIRQTVRKETRIIQPTEWVNLWIHIEEIILAGYLTHDEFSRRANAVPEGSRVFQYNRTKRKNLAVPIVALKPLSSLFERLKRGEKYSDS